MQILIGAYFWLVEISTMNVPLLYKATRQGNFM